MRPPVNPNLVIAAKPDWKHGHATGHLTRVLGFSIGLLALATTGCSTLPSPGPLVPNVNNEATASAPPFLLVPVSRITLAELKAAAPEDLQPMATPQPVAPRTIRIGDQVSVTLWEFGSNLLGAPQQTAGALGFAAPSSLIAAQSAALPKQVVDQSGMIMVPFAGDIRAAGRTTRQVQADIIAALRGKASNTQALVQVDSTTENTVTVAGDLDHPGRYPLALGGTRLLDAVSLGDGTTGKSRDMVVQLSRGGEVRSMRLSAVMADPIQNIYMQPGDVVTLDNEPQSVVVLGATNKNTEVVFGKSRITLAEAIGNGGGLADKQADPYGVYVLRNEMTATAQRLRAEPIPDYMAVGDTVPVIYHVNMKSVDGMLLAQNFTMQDRDVVYVANSPSVQVGKLANLFNSISGIFKSNTLNQYTY